MEELFEKTEKLRAIMARSDNAVLFTGAGFSVPSGIPDFRSEKGLYRTENGGRYPAEYMLSHGFFEARPEEFFKFYKEKMLYPDARPNVAHEYFALLEKRNVLKAVMTQNIDGLHQAAGSRNVFELHGSVLRNNCTRCGKKFGLDYVLKSEGVPRCDVCGGIVRPDVVLYGENLDAEVLRGAAEAVAGADTLIVAGTSLAVYPAAGLLDYFRGKNLVLLNKGATGRENAADLVINADVAEVCKLLITDFKL